MLRIYIFKEQNDNWIEEEQNLLLHDHCAFLDDEQKKLYLWNGPKSANEKKKKAQESIKKIISRYPDDLLEIVILLDDIPKEIQNKIDEMLLGVKEEEKKSKLLFNRVYNVRLYFFFTIIALSMTISALINTFLSLFWPASNGNLTVSSNFYNLWINISLWLYILTAASFLITCMIGLWERDFHASIYALAGLLISIGIVLYLSQGIFLFKFELDSTQSTYIISIFEIVILSIALLIPSLIFIIPNCLKLWSFYKTYKEFIILEYFQERDNSKEVKTKKRSKITLLTKKLKSKKSTDNNNQNNISKEEKES